MQVLKQSTVVTLKIGPFLDETDGKTAETGLTISQADVRLSKNGGNIAQKNDATACTHDELGVYNCPVNATDTGTLGRLQLWVHESGALPVFHEYMIVSANVWDSLYGSDKLQVDVREKGDANMGLTTQEKADVDAEADEALTTYDPPTRAEATADKDALLADHTVIKQKAAGSYDRETDSLEAIRDRGDAAWVTGGGGSIDEILNIQPLIPFAIDLANTATVRIGLGLTNMVDDLPSTAEITPGTITIDRKPIGGTSWTNIVNAAACSEAAGLVYYDEVFDSGSGYAAGDTIRITFKSQKITVAANDYEITGSDGWIFHTYIREAMRGTDSGATASALSTHDGKLDLVKTEADKIAAGALGTPITDSLADQVMNKDGSKTFDKGTDSLEAIRDRGDAAWVTGTTINDILNIQALVPNAIDLANTATVRIGLGLTNMIDDLPTTAEITPGTITIDRKAVGGTSWTNVVNATACSEVAGVIYYDEVFDSGSGYAAGDTIRITFKNQKITVDANDYEITGSDGWIFHTFIREAMRGTDSAATASALNTHDGKLGAFSGSGGDEVKTQLSRILSSALLHDIYTEVIYATSQDDTRKVAIGEIDRVNFKVKDKDASDWSSPIYQGTVYAWYKNLGESIPYKYGPSS